VNRGNTIVKKISGRAVILFCLLIAVCSPLFAQVKFSASAPKSVGVNQQFQLTYTVENGAARGGVHLPSFDDFQLLGGPSTSQNMSWVNGQVSQSVTYSYVLQPKKEGTYTIGKATANIEGASMESNDLTITVTGPVQQQAQRRRDPFDPFGMFDDDPFQQQQQQQAQQQQRQPQASSSDNQKTLKENVFVRLVTDKSSVYMGERVTATMRLYFNFNVASLAIPKAPTFDGFWSQEVQMPKEPKARVETVNGQQYHVVDIQIYNLYPQRPGTLKITQAELDMVVQAPVGRGFFGMQYQNMQMKASSNGVAITVRDLPAAGKPADFSGAVGQYTYSAKLSSKEGKTDNAVTYSVKIAGSGNLKTIDLPKPQMPDGFEVFDPKVKDDVTSSANGMGGSKQYDYLMIPRQPGDYKIPGSTFSYFDPSAGRYFTLSSPDMPLKITGEPSQNLNAGAAATASKEDVAALHSDIRFIKTRSGDLTKAGTPFFGSAGYAGLLATPLLLFAGLIFVKRKNEDLATDLVGAKRRRATRLAKKRLSAAEKHLVKNDKTAFYDEVSRAIWGYLGDKLNIDQSQLSKDNVEEKLLAKNVKTETIARLKSLISICEVALYAPIGAGDQMKMNYNSAIALITDLEDEIK
jgi:hypothetical protein